MRFWQALTAVAECERSQEALTTELRAAILSFGSETADNLDCANHIEIAEANNRIGPMLQNSQVMIEDLAWDLEDLQRPASIKSSNPNLTEEDWQRFMRLVTLMFAALTHDKTPGK